MRRPYRPLSTQYGTNSNPYFNKVGPMAYVVNWEKMTGAYTPAATTPAKKPSTQVAKKKKLAARIAKKKRPAKPTAKKRVAPKPSAPKLKSGKRQSAIWDEIILPHLNGIVENGRPFASLGRACDAAKERLKGCEKGLSDSAIERGIKRNRPLWCRRWV